MPGEHIMWVLGVDNIEDALKKLEGFRLAGVAEKVQCPYLLTHGERDAQIPMEDARAVQRDRRQGQDAQGVHL